MKKSINEEKLNDIIEWLQEKHINNFKSMFELYEMAYGIYNQLEQSNLL